MKRIVSMLLAISMVLTGAVLTLGTSVAAAPLGASGTTFTIALEDGTTTDIEVIVHDGLAEAVLPLVNEERAKEGLAPFIWDTLLEDGAVLRAAEASIAGTANNSNHIRPDGTDWSTVLPDHKPYGSYAENLAGGMKTAEAAVNAWMNSPGHRANILHPTCTSMAVGCVEDENGVYHWVQLFGSLTGTDTPDPGATYTVTFNSNGGTAVASQTVKAGGLVVQPANPTRANYTFTGWYRNAALTSPWSFAADTVSSNTILYAGWTYRGGGGGGGGGSSGSSRSSSGTTASTTATSAAATYRPSSNVGTDGSVSSASVKSQVESAVAASGSSATVQTRNAQSISAATLRTMASAAGNKALTLYADTTTADGSTVQGRLYVEPAKLSGRTTDLKLGVYTESSKVSAVKRFFQKWFRNNVAVIRLEQQGSFGVRMQVAAKIDLSGLDTQSLRFYSYDRTSNQYSAVSNPEYSIDSNGYLHFYTEKAGDIIITDQALSGK